MAWTTRDELNYLEGLGDRSCSAALRLGACARPMMLSGYLAGARARTDWGHVDREKAVSTAQQMLANAVTMPREELPEVD